MEVYVLNKEGKPLMPCRPVIARLLLKEGKAKCIRRTPTVTLTERRKAHSPTGQATVVPCA